MKPFDLERAKVGDPVCTRDGRDVEILRIGLRKTSYPVLALVVEPDGAESAYQYTEDGIYDPLKLFNRDTSGHDLMMKEATKSGWIYVYVDKLSGKRLPSTQIFNREEEACRAAEQMRSLSELPVSAYFVTKISWEESL